jgi:hypothetical protein
MSRDYLALLQKNTLISPSDKSDKSTLGTFVTPDMAHKNLFSEKTPEIEPSAELKNIPVDGTDRTDKTAVHWLLHFADREPLEVTFTPALSHGEVLEQYPDALAAEPVTPGIGTDDTLSASDELTIRGWLADIGEADQSIVDVVVEQCQHDAAALAYFLARAGEANP